MIELIYTSHNDVKHYMGVSGDVQMLPLDVNTGSDCLMLDTGELYVYHAGERHWYKQENRGGGGGGCGAEEKHLSDDWITILSDAEVDEPLDLVDDVLPCLRRQGLYSCDKIRSVEMKAAYVLKMNSIYNCRNLVSVRMPQLIYTDSGALSYNQMLESVYAPNLRMLGNNTLLDNPCLQEVDLPNATTVGKSSIAQCNTLRSVRLPSCSQLEEYAIARNPELTTIELLGGMSGSFGKMSMSNNPKLMNVVIRSDFGVPSMPATAFTGTPFETEGSDARIYVPQDMVSQFRMYAEWSAYRDRFVPIEGSPFEQW